MTKPKAAAKPGPRKRYQQPPFIKTEAQSKAAEMLFGLGATREQVAKHLGISKSTVQRHFMPEFQEGWGIANLQLYGKLWEKAVRNKDTACLIFLAKNRLGMRDRFNDDEPPPPQPNGAPTNIMVKVELVSTGDPRALKPPPADRLPQMIEAKAREKRAG